SSTATAAGIVSLFDDNGAALTMDFGGPVGRQSQVSYSIPPDGVIKFSTSGADPLKAGYAVVTPQSGALPVASAIYSVNGKQGLASEAGVLSSIPTTSARMYVEATSSPLNRNTGFALVNRNSSPATVNLSLIDNLSRAVQTQT